MVMASRSRFGKRDIIELLFELLPHIGGESGTLFAVSESAAADRRKVRLET
jgi:hypothetical protein